LDGFLELSSFGRLLAQRRISLVENFIQSNVRRVLWDSDGAYSFEWLKPELKVT
jgi:hypothetical protein